MGEFTMEIGDLYKAGKVILPTMASHFRNAVEQIPGDELEWVFRRPDGIGAGATGPYHDWRRVMDVLEHAANKTAVTLDDVGEAAVLHVKDTIKTEHVVSETLKNRMKKLDRKAREAGL